MTGRPTPGQRVSDVPFDDLDLPRHGHRAVVGLAVLTGPDVGRPLGQLLQERVIHLVHDVDAFDAHAGLAGVGQCAPRGRVGRGIQVSIGADQERVLAAALRHHGGQVLRAGRHHLLGRASRSGERDLVYGAEGQRLAGLPAPGHQLQHRLLGNHFSERVHQPATDRGGQLARLEYHRVACGERVDNGSERGEDGVVPGPDHADHAERLVFEPGSLIDGDQPAPDPARAEHPARFLRRPVDVDDREQDLQLGVGEGLSRLVVHEFREAGQVPGDM